jgi:hypothetical protein
LVGIDLVLSVGIDNQELYRRAKQLPKIAEIAKYHRDLKTASLRFSIFGSLWHFWQSMLHSGDSRPVILEEGFPEAL